MTEHACTKHKVWISLSCEMSCAVLVGNYFRVHVPSEVWLQIEHGAWLPGIERWLCHSRLRAGESSPDSCVNWDNHRCVWECGLNEIIPHRARYLEKCLAWSQGWVSVGYYPCLLWLTGGEARGLRNVAGGGSLQTAWWWNLQELAAPPLRLVTVLTDLVTWFQ